MEGERYFRYYTKETTMPTRTSNPWVIKINSLIHYIISFSYSREYLYTYTNGENNPDIFRRICRRKLWNTMEMGNDNGKRNENKLKKEIIQRIHLRSFLVTNCFEILLGVPRSYEYFEPWAIIKLARTHIVRDKYLCRNKRNKLVLSCYLGCTQRYYACIIAMLA